MLHKVPISILLIVLLASPSLSQNSSFRIVEKPIPKMPENYGQLCLIGTIILRIEFLSTGSIGKVSVVKGIPVQDLTDLAIDAAKTIKFIPEQRDGKPITVFRQVEYAYGWHIGGWKRYPIKIPPRR